jgi:tRNA (mo5U34)-methyltransferase
MEGLDIRNKINSFNQWHYQFDLHGHKTPIADESWINRHEQRYNYFFLPLVDLFSGSLSGKRILDLGCNAGFWSLHAIMSGCNYVLGIDGRQMHIDQADLVFEVKGIDTNRYDFVCANIFDYLRQDLSQFDIVLCLGLLYHINKPILLMEQISNINSDVLVIDTLLSKRKGSLFELRHETLLDPRNAIENELVLVPTKDAVFDMIHQYGYRAVIIEPEFKDYTGAQDFKTGHRRAFICSKTTDISNFATETNPNAD